MWVYVGGGGGERREGERNLIINVNREDVYMSPLYTSRNFPVHLIFFSLMKRFKNSQKKIREPVHLWSFYQDTPVSREHIREDSPSSSSLWTSIVKQNDRRSPPHPSPTRTLPAPSAQPTGFKSGEPTRRWQHRTFWIKHTSSGQSLSLWEGCA